MEKHVMSEIIIGIIFFFLGWKIREVLYTNWLRGRVDWLINGHGVKSGLSGNGDAEVIKLFGFKPVYKHKEPKQNE